jgi:hypothetical protein
MSDARGYAAVQTGPPVVMLMLVAMAVGGSVALLSRVSLAACCRICYLTSLASGLVSLME